MDKKPEYKGITLESIEKAIGDMFYNRKPEEERDVKIYLTGTEEQMKASLGMFHKAMKEAWEKELLKQLNNGNTGRQKRKV